MKVTKIYCDACGEEPALTHYFTTDRRMDAAGSSEDVDEPMDLCHKCTWQAYLLTSPSHETAEKVLKELTHRGIYRANKR